MSVRSCSDNPVLKKPLIIWVRRDNWNSTDNPSTNKPDRWKQLENLKMLSRNVTFPIGRDELPSCTLKGERVEGMGKDGFMCPWKRKEKSTVWLCLEKLSACLVLCKIKAFQTDIIRILTHYLLASTCAVWGMEVQRRTFVSRLTLPLTFPSG